ncbi:hypothetical protein GDO81_026247 [Engystomops pustulosus]|uniref:Uncharacterized protein n=1 Tax=Engystomops pustulosus TaxID=76066 RepID=A0AAV6YHJ7_ENGPU|nr:hypothetical protein GDO81_026247 [Engystomops pustulosus]
MASTWCYSSCNIFSITQDPYTILLPDLLHCGVIAYISPAAVFSGFLHPLQQRCQGLCNGTAAFSGFLHPPQQHSPFLSISRSSITRDTCTV